MSLGAGARAGRRRLLLLLFTVALIVLPILVAPVPAEAQTPGHSEISVTVDVENKSVIIDEYLEPLGRRGTVTAFLPPNATAISSDGRILNSVARDDYIEVNVVVGDGATLSYTLPSTIGRAAEGTRVNEAMIGFRLWPNLTTAEVRVTLPRGFVANVGSDFLPKLIADETLEYTLATVRSDALWGLWFVAFRDSGLERRVVSLENVDVEVAAWADDPEWMEFAVEYVSAGIPLLEDQIGLDWPRGDLRLVESVAPDQAGYGGWFNRLESEIEIPDSLDSEVFLHELSHAWFNDRLFDERWMIEGFAEEYASSVGEELTDGSREAAPPAPAPEGFAGLNEWRSKLWFEDTWDVEIYGYGTAFWVVQELRAEIGDEGMQATLAGMARQRHPYARDGETRAVGSNDWRRFLDMLEIEGGSTAAEELFREFVVTDAEGRLLDVRRETMGHYADLEAESDLDVPESIRVAMSAWRFDDARRGIDRAQAAVIKLDELDARARQRDLTLPSHLAQLYLRSEIDFSRLERAIDDTDEVLRRLELAGEEIDAETARNFALGRFDDIDLGESIEDQSALNRDREPRFSYKPYLIALAILIVFLAVVSVVWTFAVQRELRERRQQEASGSTPPEDDRHDDAATAEVSASGSLGQ